MAPGLDHQTLVLITFGLQYVDWLPRLPSLWTSSNEFPVKTNNRQIVRPCFCNSEKVCGGLTMKHVRTKIYASSIILISAAVLGCSQSGGSLSSANSTSLASLSHADAQIMASTTSSSVQADVNNMIKSLFIPGRNSKHQFCFPWIRRIRIFRRTRLMAGGLQ